MRINITRALGLMFLAASLVFAQQKNSSKRRQEQLVYTELAKVPEKARARHDPFEGNSGAAAAGRKLFKEHCAECHGNTAAGTRRGPSLRSEEVQQATAGALFWVLTNGVVRRGMPDWSKLPEPQRWQIVTYLKSLEASTVTKSQQR